VLQRRQRQCRPRRCDTDGAN